MEPASPAPASVPATEPAPPQIPAAVAASPEAPAGSAAVGASGGVSSQAGEASDEAGAASQPAAADDADVAAAAAEPTREGRSLKDMVLSLAVLVVPIALLLIFYRVVLSGDAPVTVDPAPTIQEARAAFTVAVPTGLGDDWHVTAATFKREAKGVTLRLGYADPDKDPIQLVESTVPTASLLPAELSTSAKPLENYRAPNGVWRLYDGRPGEQALVLADQNRTIIVVGRTDVQNLKKLAGSLG